MILNKKMKKCFLGENFEFEMTLKVETFSGSVKIKVTNNLSIAAKFLT